MPACCPVATGLCRRNVSGIVLKRLAAEDLVVESRHSTRLEEAAAQFVKLLQVGPCD